MSLLRSLLPLLLLHALAWGQALHQEKVGFYVANKAGSDCSQTTLELADDAALASGQALAIPATDRLRNACQWVISSDTTIDSPIFVPYSSPNPIVKVNAGVTLTLTECPIAWGNYYIIDADESTTGTVTFTSACTQCAKGGPNEWTFCQTTGGTSLAGAATSLNLSDTTPEVTLSNALYACTDTTLYTDFVDSDGDHSDFTDEFIIYIVAESECSLDCTSSNILCNNGSDWSPAIGQSTQCMFSPISDKWSCNVSDPTIAANDLVCTDCVDRTEIEVGGMLNVKTQSITGATDTIDCDSEGPVLVRLDADADYTLTSNPQISVGGIGHLCTVEWTDTIDALELVDGNGVNHYGDVPKTLNTTGQSATYYYDGSLWQELAPILPGCTYTFPAGVPTLDCGQTTTITRIVDTEFIPVSWCNDGTTPPAALTEHGQADYRNFDSAAAEDLLCAWLTPEDLDESIEVNQLKVQALYAITNATTPAANEGVSWGIAACSSGTGDTLDCTEGTEVNSETADLDAHAQWDVVSDSYVEVTVTDLTAGEFVRFSVQRDVADAEDDYLQDVGLIGFILKFYRTPGSIDY